MTGTEGLAILVREGLFPEDEVGELLRFCDDVEAAVEAGELTKGQAAAALDAHAQRITARRGPVSVEQKEIAQAVGLALDADGQPS